MATYEALHIQNLRCRYPGSDADVLRINELIISKGKLVFVLGSSGVGKSTFLETVGLMNQTATEGKVNLYPADSNSKPINLIDLWKAQPEKLDAVRKQHLSFIFQQTNLMENFTAYENLCLSKMIKEDVDLNAGIESSKPLLNKLGMGDSVMDVNRMPNLLSGGQRQRLAFIRALNNSAKLILCDEPTGNLDEHNASVVMSLLKDSCKEGKTTIVVSHDINLALNFADEIILVTKSVNGYGEVLLENIFSREAWEENPKVREDLRAKIKSSFVDDSSSNSNSVETTTKPLHLNAEYKDLFLKKEFKAIVGLKKVNLLILSIILAFTYLATGFSNGSLDYLSLKMDDPFINLVELIVPRYYSGSDNQHKIHEIIDSVNSKENREKYFIEAISPYYIDYFAISRSSDINKTDNYKLSEIRTVNATQDKQFIEDFVLAKGNLIKGNTKSFSDSMDFRVIVTADFLEKLEYEPDADYILFRYAVDIYDSLKAESRVRYFNVPIGIHSITKALPGKRGMLMPDKLYFGLFNQEKKIDKFSEIAPYYNRRDLSIVSYDTSSSARELIKKFIQNEFPENNLTVQSTDNFGHTKLDEYLIDFDQPVELDIGTEAFWQMMQDDPELSRIKLLRKVDIAGNDFVNYSFKKIEVQKMSTYFTKLDKVREFDTELRAISSEYKMRETEQTEISADISKIEEKESYLFISTVSVISSTILLIFSVLSISLFLAFLINNHLNKIKMNLGTFSAIGLSSKIIKQIYFKIILKFIITALSIALFAAIIIGALSNFILLKAFKSDLDMNYFKVFHPYTLLVTIIILLAALAISRYTINKSLSKTPGDLIYNR